MHFIAEHAQCSVPDIEENAPPLPPVLEIGAEDLHSRTASIIALSQVPMLTPGVVTVGADVCV